MGYVCFGEGRTLRAAVIRQRPAGSRLRAYPDLPRERELRRSARTAHDATPAMGGLFQRRVPGPGEVTPLAASPIQPQPHHNQVAGLAPSRVAGMGVSMGVGGGVGISGR